MFFFEWTVLSVIGPREVHVFIPEMHEPVTLHGKRNFVAGIMVRSLR